ncbi:aromatic prenyltransferase [Viridothelium virens]|uniref:Aromatic prenyltransferase n=1 Tax=Viridothelium virens TaxID=1048519 RepID=A0A6A6GS19_VIRVR|nr:aromatic prenyltransferase [Viridothelium virens]
MSVSVLPVSNLSFKRVDQDIQSNRNENKAFWWGVTAQSLATLLQTSQYSEEEQLYYLQWYQQWIAGSFGPAPVGGKPHYSSSFTYDGSPLEYSLNWKEKKKNGQTVRFTIEPSSLKSGTAADRLNQVAAKDLLTAMAKHIPGIDMVKFDLFLSEFRVPNDKADEILQKFPEHVPKLLVVTAFDLENGSIGAKAYFNPVPKAIHMGTSTNAVVLDAVRKWSGPAGTYVASVEVLDGYLKTFSGDNVPIVFLLSNDCAPDSPATRAKVYVNTLANTLAKVKHAFDLGGRISGPMTEAGLEAIEDFWFHRFGLYSSDPDLENKEVLDAGARAAFVYEMRPVAEGEKEANIEVKLHMPASWLGQTDEQICKVLSTWFQKCGHADLAERYERDLKSTFPKHDLSSKDLTHTWISLTYTPKTGLYMTMYYTPKLPEVNGLHN